MIMVTENEIKEEIKKCGFKIEDPKKPLKYKTIMKLNGERWEIEMYNFIVAFGSDLDCSEKICKMIDKFYEAKKGGDDGKEI